VQQEMDHRNIPHFALYYEAESRWQIALQQEAVNITGVVCDHYAATQRQIVDSADRYLYAGQYKDYSGRMSD
jgi:hypothetical protein